MALELERLATPSTRLPETRAPREQESDLKIGLNICVVFTSIDATLAALKQAGSLANRLGAQITLMVPQIVPRPLPLDKPPVSAGWNENRFRTIASTTSVETAVQIYLCRDRWEALESVLQPHSLVVVGGRKRWWPTAESRLANKLRKAGHEVIFTETE